MKHYRQINRSGTVLPILGICLISLFGFVALAVDVGMLAVARTQCQNAADCAALVGCRNLNNQNAGNTSYDNNRPAAILASQTAVPNNTLLNGNFTSAQIQSITAGIYSYNTTTQTFSATYPTTLPTGGAWSAMQVVVAVNQPTYFAKIFGITSMPNGASAVAVHRPRDTAFALDMTGSMRFAAEFNSGEQGTTTNNNMNLNPDTIVPTFGHYVSYQSSLTASANLTDSAGEAISRNNYTMTTPGGPPIIRNFYFDPVNLPTASNPNAPATPAYPVTSNTASLINAFHRWSPPETPGDSSNYVPQTYDFTGYNAYSLGNETNPTGPTPAPYSFMSMTDSTSPAITYVGDRWRRKDGSINKADTTWAVGTNYQAAASAIDLLGYTLSGTNVQANGTTVTTVDKFRDGVWEKYGYDLKINQYRTDRGTGGPLNPSTYVPTSNAAADAFTGFSMGPGYYGKTFYIWPPDPRWGGGTGIPDPTSPSATNPAKDTNGNWICDWRKRFFLNNSGIAFTTGATVATAGIDQTILANSNNFPLNNGGFQINYSAVLKWIKSGPLVLPPNLRAGRILFYSSIPDDVNTATGTTQQVLDKQFWKNYIEYVLAQNYTSASSLYGIGVSWSSATNGARSVYASLLNPWQGPGNAWSTNVTPYMAYSDSPNRPLLHMWFGPLSMAAFIANAVTNWNPGTCYESQCWQLKAGMNSVLTDLQNNHPNDYVGMTMFSYVNTYKSPRVGIGQNFTGLKNALFYPLSLLPVINSGDTTTEERPYDSNFNSVSVGEIPNANGGTDPNTGLMVAFNLLSPSSLLPTSTYGTVRGRKGASKIVIFETDGVPNSYSSFTLSLNGYNTYYTNLGNGGAPGNGSSQAINPAIAVVQQMAKTMSTSNAGGVDSGLALGNAPVRVYPVAFGDLFDPVAAPNASFRPTALQFLANLAAAGGTGASGATTISSNQIITGSYATRISNLQNCLSTIFQSGVSVTLIQ